MMAKAIFLLRFMKTYCGCKKKIEELATTQEKVTALKIKEDAMREYNDGMKYVDGTKAISGCARNISKRNCGCPNIKHPIVEQVSCWEAVRLLTQRI